MLGRQVVQARQLVTKLLAGRLTFEPQSREGRQGFLFDGTGTSAKLVPGVVPGDVVSFVQAVASPDGSAPRWYIDFRRQFRAA